MKRHFRDILLIGLVLGLVLGKASIHFHNTSFDGKIFYIGGRLLLSGGNPYSGPDLLRASAQYAPEGWPAGHPTQLQLHFPATLIVFAPFSLLPWPVFCWVLALAIGLSAPLIAWLCLRYFEPEPSTAALIKGTLLVMIIPAAWQNFALGQVGLFEILFMLLTDRALLSKRYGWAVLFGFFALLKPTCFIPLLFVLFVREERRGRMALLGAAGVNLGVNLLGAVIIGPKLFFDSYQVSSRQMALPTAPLDPMSGYRIDMNVLSAAFLHGAALTAAGLLLTTLLWGGYYWIGRKSGQIGLADIAALSLLALLLVYHQAYDAVLLAPAMLYGYQLFRASRLRPVEWVYMGCLVLCVLAFGNHNVVDLLLKPLHRVQPIYFRPVVLLATYGVLLLSLSQQRSEIEARRLV